MIVAFTGGRDYRNKAMVEAMVRAVVSTAEYYYYASDEGGPIHLRFGDCGSGVDVFVRDIAAELYGSHVLPIQYPARWDKEGLAAGPIRNRRMLTMWADKGRQDLGAIADLLIAFPGGKGTADCVRQARELGIAVIEVPS